MNKVLALGIDIAETIGKAWAFIGRSITLSVSRGSFSAVESFVNALINTTCLVGLVFTLPGVIIFTGVALPVDLVILAAGGVIEGCILIEATIESAKNWRAAAAAVREEDKQERDAAWERRKPTILSRIYITQALQANGIPLDVADMITHNILPSYPNAPVLTANDIELLTKHNHAMISRVYHAKKNHVVIEMTDDLIEFKRPTF